MNRFVVLLFSAIMSTIMMAQRKETTILEVSGSLATPLTVQTSKGTYTVYNRTELNGSISVRSAVDANGNKVVVPNGDYKSHTSNGKSEYTRIYRFKTLYNSSSSSSSNSSGSSYGSNRDSRGSSYGGGSSYSQQNPNYTRFDRIIEETRTKCANVTNPDLEGRWGETYDGRWQFEVKKVDNEYKIYLNPDVYSWDDIREYPNMIIVYHDSEFDHREDLRKKRWNSYIDDCNEDADPGYSRYGTYKYNVTRASYVHIYYLTNSGVTSGPTLIHSDYYLNGTITYSDTEIMEMFAREHKRY